jgi:DNA-binding NarL/FixJ family response regulator
VTSVLLVDDHPLVRAGLADLLAGSEHIEVVGEAGDGRQAVELVSRLRPDVVLMDLSMPVLDGVAATRLVLQEVPSTRVVVLTSFADRHRMAEAVAAGAVGFLLKDCDPRDLVGAVCSVARGHGPLDPRLADDRWWEPPRWLPGLRHSRQPRVAAPGRAVNAR